MEGSTNVSNVLIWLPIKTQGPSSERKCSSPVASMRQPTDSSACEQEGQRGFAAARRAEQEQARKARALQERGQALGEVALSDEKSQFGGAQAFRQRLGQGHEGSKLARRGGYC